MRRAKLQSMVYFVMPLVVALVAHAMATFWGSCAIHSIRQRQIELRRALLERAASLRQDIDHARWLISQRGPGGVSDAPGQTGPADVPEQELLKRLDELQHEMAFLTSELRRLSQLQQDVDRKRRTRQVLHEESKQLDEQIAQASQRLEAVRQELGRAMREYGTFAPTIVAIDRDAVFIDCDGSGAKVLPEGTRLSSQARPAEQDLLRKRLREQGAAFFLVRPDGVGSFGLYRRIVQGFGLDTNLGPLAIGYEPVPSNARIKVETKDGKTRVIISYES